jgi:hypothetical protein
MISEVTETKESSRSAAGAGVQIADGGTSNYFLTTFGRATRDTVCSCEVKMELNLSQRVSLNGSTVQKVTQGGVIKKMLEAAAGNVVDELYLCCLGCKPTRRNTTCLGR